MMSLEYFKTDLNEKENFLTGDQKRNIHFKSLKNFLIHYDILPDREKSKAALLLNEYYNILHENDWTLNIQEGKRLFFSHIVKIGAIYNYYLGFKAVMGINGALFGGICIDLVLLITGFLKHIHYIPLATLILICYNRFLIILYGKKNKLYGPHF